MDRLPQFVAGAGRYHGPALAALEPLRRALAFEDRREVIPDSPNQAVGPQATYEHRITVPVGSFLWAVAGNSEQPEGFRLQIVDAGAGRGLLSQSAHFSHSTGGSTSVRNWSGATVEIRQALYVLPKPKVVIEPGMLRVQITNRSGLVNGIQAVLHFAAPLAPGAARNQWDEICAAEAELARRALMGQLVVTAAGGAAPGAPAPDLSDPMLQPASNIPFNVSAAGANLVIPGAQGYRVAIHQLSLFNTAEQTVRLLDGDTDLMGPLVNMAAGTGYFLPYQEEPHFVLTDGRSFQIHLAGAPVGAVTGFAKYRMLERWGTQ